MIEKYEKVVGRLLSWTTYIADFFLFAIMLLVVANVCTRRFFNAPIFGVTELVCYGSLAAAALGLGQTEWLDGNVRMTLMFEKTKPRFGCFLNLIVNIVGLFGFSYVSYFMVLQTVTKYTNGQLSSEIRFPMYIVTGILALGFVLLTLALAAKLVLYIMRLSTGNITIASPKETHLRKDEEV